MKFHSRKLPLLPSPAEILVHTKETLAFCLHANQLRTWKCHFTFLSFSLHAWVLSHLSHVQLFVTPWAVAHQAPLSMGFSRQEYWSGLPCPSPGNLPNPGLNSCLLCLLHWEVGSLPLVPSGKPKAQFTYLQNGHSNYPLEEKLWHT